MGGKQLLIIGILVISMVGLGIGFLSSSQKTTDTSILGTGIVSNRTVEARPTEAPTPTAFIYLSPTPVMTKTYKYGERVSLKDGRYITVYTPIIGYKPEETYMEAPQGKKYVLVEVSYENMGNKKTACYVTLRLGDDKDYFFDNYMNVKQPTFSCQNMEDQSYLQPGKTVRGFITFQVNEDTIVQKLIYQDGEHNEKVTFSET